MSAKRHHVEAPGVEITCGRVPSFTSATTAWEDVTCRWCLRLRPPPSEILIPRTLDEALESALRENQHLSAEVRRLQGLPVLRTCGDCAHAEKMCGERKCGHPSRKVPWEDLPAVEWTSAPLADCPLRHTEESHGE